MPETFTLLHEDAAFLAVDKPVGIAVIPERQGQACLKTALEAARGETLYTVHRIDKETSGVVLFARTPEMHRHLSLCFEHGAVEKRYAALVLGRPQPPEGLIEAPLRQFGSGRMGIDAAGGKASATRYRLRRRCGALSWLDVYPLTGRRHQIRVHLYSIGCPVAGDPLYGERPRRSDYPRMMLHAASVSVPLPGGEAAHLRSPIPEALREAAARPERF